MLHALFYNKYNKLFVFDSEHRDNVLYKLDCVIQLKFLFRTALLLLVQPKTFIFRTGVLLLVQPNFLFNTGVILLVLPKHLLWTGVLLLVYLCSFCLVVCLFYCIVFVAICCKRSVRVIIEICIMKLERSNVHVQDQS